MTDNIKPEHYRTGEIDLYEAWYQTYPFDQYRAIMQAIAERYMRRDKIDRVEDLDKAMETLKRLKEKEIEHAGESEEVVTQDGMKVFKEDKLLRKINIETAGQYWDEIYYHHDDLLKRLKKGGYDYLARDEDGELYAYKGIPKKYDGMGFWDTYTNYSAPIKQDNFPEVKWTDDEPTKIADLLEIYQNSGENGK